MKHIGGETDKAAGLWGSSRTPRELIKAYGEVKKAALKAQQDYNSRYSEQVSSIIIDCIDEIIAGRHDGLFVLPLHQGGAGTSLHMNINEVIARLVNERIDDPKAVMSEDGSYRVDPLDDIALYQSTNDTFPTAVIILLYRMLLDIEGLVIKMQEVLVENEQTYSNILLTGRTELQSALPITLGQVFGAWAGSIERDRWRLHKLKDRLRNIPLGGTAMGTCFSAPRKWVFLAEKYIRQITGLPLCRSQNLPDGVAHLDSLSELASGFGIAAENLFKITGDLMLYSSSFIGELKHPELQYGSSIMPDKVNPVSLEYVRGLSIHIQGEVDKISRYSQEGQLQLNAYLPFMLQAFLEIGDGLKQSYSILLDRFFPSLEIDKRRIEGNLLNSNILLNSLRPVIGYQNVKALVEELKGREAGSTAELKDFIRERTDLTGEFLDKWFDPLNLTSYLQE